MNEPNLFGKTEFLKDVKSINDQSATSDLDLNRGESQARSGVTELAGVLVLQDQSHRSESGSGLTTRQHTSRINDLWTAILVALVIGVAVLLGVLVGFRRGRQGSSLELRVSSPTHRENAASKTGQTAQAVSAARELQPASASAEGCDQPISHGAATEPPRGGLTICQRGRVIFSLPHSALAPSRDLQTSQSSPDLEQDLTRDSHAH